MKRALISVAGVAILVAACGNTPAAPTAGACASPAPSGAVRVEARIDGGRAAPEPHRVAVPLHATVQVRVSADKVVPVHIHGYEIEFDAAPGAPGCVAFVAGRAGLFDVEAHPDTLLVQLEVR